MKHMRSVIVIVLGAVFIATAGCGADKADEYTAPAPQSHAPLGSGAAQGMTPGAPDGSNQPDPTEAPAGATPGATPGGVPSGGTQSNSKGPKPATPAQTMPGQPPVTAPATPGSADTFTMPGLVGMDVLKAQDALSGQGAFNVTWRDASGRSRPVETSPDWKVCGQRPAAGTAVDFTVLMTLTAVPSGEACS